MTGIYSLDYRAVEGEGGLFFSASCPSEAEYWRAFFMKFSPNSMLVSCFVMNLAALNGNILGFGLPPAKEINDSGELCISRATVNVEEDQFGEEISILEHKVNTK